MKSKTRPAVFIIESLDFDDEQHGARYEGKVLAQFLDIANLENRYTYVRTRKELRAFLDEFKDSNYRYLHFSCHGNATSIGLTLDDLSVAALAKELARVLARRRLFLSACEVTGPSLARELFTRCSECYSLVGPATAIRFSDATVFWAAFYHLMFQEEQTAMKRATLKDGLRKLSDIFNVRMNAFMQDSDEDDGFEHFRTDGRSMPS